MNRIEYLINSEPQLGRVHTSHSTGLATSFPPAGETPYCLFTPQHYERNYAYPLVVWLHGPDDDERQVTRVMPLVSLRNYVAVGPRGTSASAVPGGYCWNQSAEHIESAQDRVAAAIEAARDRLNIAPGRIYLAGYACGGTMALRIALNQPERFAGAVSVGGAFPSGLRPLARLHAARRLNLLLATGRESLDYPQRDLCQHLQLLHAAGIPLNLRLYPCGDEVTEDMLADIDRWVMEQVAGEDSATWDQPSHSSRHL